MQGYPFPRNPIAEILSLRLKTPRNALGEENLYPEDLKALEDWLLEREWRRIPGVFDISSFGGVVKRYEIHPNPESMKSNGISLQQLSTPWQASNVTVSGDFLKVGSGFKAIICRGLIGGHKDPIEHAITLNTAEEAAAYLRDEERRRCNEIRSIVITSINDKPILIDDIVDGGPIGTGETRVSWPMANTKYALPSAPAAWSVSHQTRLGIVSYDQCLDHETGKWLKQDEKVEGVVLMRKTPAHHGGPARVKSLADDSTGCIESHEPRMQRVGDWFTNERPAGNQEYRFGGDPQWHDLGHWPDQHRAAVGGHGGQRCWHSRRAPVFSAWMAPTASRSTRRRRPETHS